MLCSTELPMEYMSFSHMFDFDFISASACLMYPSYFEHYKHGAARRFRILNTGGKIENDDYYEVAKEIKPDLLIIPDAPPDQSATAIMASSFMDFWKDKPLEKTELVGVLNGISEHLLRSVHGYYSLLGIHHYGFPNNGTDRAWFLRKYPDIRNIHILGLTSISEALTLQSIPVVQSIVSNLPIKVTRSQNYLGQYFGTQTEPVSIECKDLYRPLLMKNLDLYDAACHGEAIITHG